ncbi:MAG: hypothetical protein KGK08_05110 [Acidobacteriota bacterium]|nr:hypothetical protein [Acidobacteriota bacterium]
MLVNSSIVLVAAVLASLATGVLVGYGVCLAMFSVFRMHAQKVAAERTASRMAQTQVAQG